MKGALLEKISTPTSVWYLRFPSLLTSKQHFAEHLSYSHEHLKTLQLVLSKEILNSFLIHFKNTNSLKDIAKSTQHDTSCQPKEFWSTIRIALTGESHGPALDEIINIYGLDKVKLRINDAINI